MIIINTHNHVLYNLFHCGLVEKENKSEPIQTSNKDYKIILERKNSRVWFTNSSYRYICKFIFYNNLDIPILDLTTSEMNIYILLDNMYYFLDNNQEEIIIPFNRSGILNNFTFYMKRNPETNNFILKIKEYNNQYNCEMERLNVEFTKEDLINFVDQIYLTFLIDIY